jgi:alcohol dehydrogenase (cytochrome c)
VIALDADTGELKWFFQFTPHDEHDRDANQIPILVDAEFEGRPRRLMLWANRNGFFYVLDRESGEYLTAQAFVNQNWADGIDSTGRPIVRSGSAPSFGGTAVRPGNIGATNWWSPSYSPIARLVYVPIVETWDLFFRGNAEIVDGEMYNAGAIHGGAFEAAAIRALDYVSGDLVWEFRAPDLPGAVRQGGLLSTAGNVVFGGIGDRFHVLDARSGKELRRFYLGGNIYAAPSLIKAPTRSR